jgi:hypothetical protein
MEASCDRAAAPEYLTPPSVVRQGSPNVNLLSHDEEHRERVGMGCVEEGRCTISSSYLFDEIDEPLQDLARVRPLTLLELSNDSAAERDPAATDRAMRGGWSGTVDRR